MKQIVRVTYKLKDKGIMVEESEVAELADPTQSLYQSLYYYTEDAVEYFTKNKNSIKGYKGKVTTPYIVFDIDSKDLDISKRNTIILIDWLKEQGLYDEYAAKIAFSGSKGFHLTLNTAYEFTPKELKSLCLYISSQVPFVEEAGFQRVDPSIYNTNRQFRVVNTINPKSGLHKIEMVEAELRNCTMDTIKEAADKVQKTYPFESSINDKPIRAILLQLKEDKKQKYEAPKEGVIKTFMGANTKRKRCIEIIQEGDMLDGESNSGLIRLASHYRRSGYTKEQCREKLVEASNNRLKKHPHTNEIDDEKIDYEILSSVYSTEGYIFTCDDWFLKKKCEGACEKDLQGSLRGPENTVEAFQASNTTPNLPNPPRVLESTSEPSIQSGFGVSPSFKAGLKPVTKFTDASASKEDSMTLSGFKTIKQSSESFREFVEDWKNYQVLTGIDELDDIVKMLPTGLVVVNAKSGVGKTSLALNVMVNCSTRDKNVLFYSIDMAEDEFFQKAKSKALKISPDDVMELYYSKDEEAKELQEEGDVLTNDMLKNVYINYGSGINPEKIDRDISAFKESGIEINLVIIDFLQKMEGCGDFSSPKAGAMLMGLKSVQSKHKVCMIGLSQIPRHGGNEETAILTAAAAKGGGVYEENASIVINMWRPMKFYTSDNGSEDKYMGYMVAKNRMGECKQGVLHFDGRVSGIRTLTDQEREDYEITFEERKQKEANKVSKGFDF